MLRFGLRDAYPGSSGTGVVQASSAGSPAAVQQAAAAAAAGVASSAKGKVTGVPLTIGSTLFTWLAFLGLIVGFMLIGQRVGASEDFKSVRLTAFNGIVISMLAIVGIIFWKLVFSAVKIPYVSDLVIEA